MSRVLLFCPTYEVDGNLHIWPQTRASIDGILPPPGMDVRTVIGVDNPYPGERHRNTLHQYQIAREVVLSEDYDALFIIEDDMIVPADALEKMWNTDALVVYGLYRFRYPNYAINAMQYTGASNIGDNLSDHPYELDTAQKRGWTEVSGIGFGCILIRRTVLEKIKFRDSDGSYPPDMGFAQDCVRAGIKQIMRFDVQCGHIADDGNVLWPGRGLSMVKCKILTDFNAPVNGRLTRFTNGENVDLPVYEAREFARAGFLEIIEQPAVKIVRKPRTDKAVK